MQIALDEVATFSTAAAVLVAAYQLRQGRRQAQTQFEDELAREYREIAQRIPVGALLNEELGPEAYRCALDDLYRYIDLSNEQAFLRQNGRVSRRAWQNWQSGMRSNLSKRSFVAAWTEVKERADADQFEELRRVEREAFACDPRYWRLRDLLGLSGGRDSGGQTTRP